MAMTVRRSCVQSPRVLKSDEKQPAPNRMKDLFESRVRDSISVEVKPLQGVRGVERNEDGLVNRFEPCGWLRNQARSAPPASQRARRIAGA